MKKTTLILFFIALVMTGCGPSEDAIQKAIEQTQMAMPTATLIPFSELNLESILIVPGDLPPGYEASQIRSERGDITKPAPVPDYFVSQMLSKSGAPKGLVDVLVYEDASKVSNAYDLASKNAPGQGTAKKIEIGEEGQIASFFLSYEVVTVTFFRCNAVVSIQFMGAGPDGARDYAKRLDERITPIVCR
jgi:hypothetical protein